MNFPRSEGCYHKMLMVFLRLLQESELIPIVQLERPLLMSVVGMVRKEHRVRRENI